MQIEKRVSCRYVNSRAAECDNMSLTKISDGRLPIVTAYECPSPSKRSPITPTPVYRDGLTGICGVRLQVRVDRSFRRLGDPERAVRTIYWISCELTITSAAGAVAWMSRGGCWR